MNEFYINEPTEFASKTSITTRRRHALPYLHNVIQSLADTRTAGLAESQTLSQFESESLT